jgi:uracil-DNA glycosylase family 4
MSGDPSVSPPADWRVMAARYLRQQIELGAPPVVLEALSAAEAQGLLEQGLPVRALEARGTGQVAPRGAEPAATSTSSSGATARPAAAASAPVASPPAPAASAASAAPEPAPASPAAGASDPSPSPSEAAVTGAGAVPPDVAAMDYETLREAALGCTRCQLAQTRTQGVFSDGHPDARVMVVGEAPGANEDTTGTPFVGAAGKLLDLMLASVGLSRRESVYICNVIKCRPPGNRNPEAHEIATCSPWLHRQIELVRPEVILAVGTFAGQLLSGHADRTLGALRGEVHRYRGVPLIVTYHPAALLRNGSWTQPTWDDLQLLRQVLDAS